MAQDLFKQLEAEYKLPAGILDAVWEKESNRGDPRFMESKKGALGHFQFMPDTAKQYGVDPADLVSSAKGAAKYLATLRDQFGGDVRMALAAYNWGQGNLTRKGMENAPAETKDYVKVIGSKIGLEDEDDMPDFDMPDFGTKERLPLSAQTKEDRNFDPKDFWMRDLDDRASSWGAIGSQIAGSIAGGVAGGSVGSIAGPPGIAAGGITGGTAGGLASLAYHLRDSSAPIEYKLEYLAKQGLIDLGFSLATGGVGKAAGLLKKVLAKNPSEAEQVAKWFAERGAHVKPTARSGSTSARGIYVDAAKQMEGVVEDAIANVENRLYTSAATDVGKTFQEGVAASRDILATEARTKLYAPFAEKAPWGDIAVNITGTKLDQTANDIVNRLTKAGAWSDNKNPSVLRNQLNMLAEAKKNGTPIPIHQLKEMKIFLSQATDFENEIGGATIANNIRKELVKAYDDEIYSQLSKVDPAAGAAWKSSNKTYGEVVSKFSNDLVAKLVDKVDPQLVADYVAKNATPQTLDTFGKAVRQMVKDGTMTAADAGAAINAVKRNWIEYNFSKPSQASELWKKLAGKGRDAEVGETFNALFRVQSQRDELLKIAKAANAFENFVEAIPRSAGIGGGTYATAQSVGGLFGGSVGATGTLATIKAMTHIPAMLAKASVTGDQGIVNRGLYVLNWMSRQQPERWQNAYQAGKTGAMFAATQEIPAPVIAAMQQVFDWYEEQE